jgi:hypothetical protein
MLTGTKSSLQGRFSLIYSKDPSLQPRPEDLPDDADDAAKKERAEAQVKYDHDLKVCRETGQWAPLLVPGASPPTLFVFELPRGEKRRGLIDAYRRMLLRGSESTAASRLVRSSLQDVTNWPGPKLTWVEEDGLRLVADDVVAFLDEITPRIVGELSGLVRDRLLEALSGK